MKKVHLLWLLFLIPFYLYCGVEPKGSGTAEDPFLIENYENLKYISDNFERYLNGYYFLQQDNIDAQASHSTQDGKGFIPIGDYSHVFSGVYDGQGYSINNLYINRDERYSGLFGKTEDTQVYNLNMNNLVIKGKKFSAGIVGYGITTSIYNCSTSGTITVGGNEYCVSAGIIGICRGACEVINCSSTVNVSGNGRISGIVEFIDSTTRVENCYYMGTLTSHIYSGGIVGYVNMNNNCTIKNCYSAANIICETFESCGMLVSKNAARNIISCIYQQDEQIGAIGNYSSVTDFDSTNFIAFTEEQMKDKSNYIDYGWDFSTTWLLDDTEINNAYPYFFWQEDSDYAMIVIDDENSQNIVVPEMNVEINFNSELPEGTQFLINSYNLQDSSLEGITNYQQTLGDSFWRIRTNYSESLTYDLTFDLSELDLPTGLNAVKILKRENENTSWTDVTDLGAQLTWQGNEVTVSGLDSFSDFIPVTDLNTLPVELSSLVANLSDDNSVSLQWIVESESNLSGYYLLYNSVNDVFSAELIPCLINATNSSQQHCYSFTDYPKSNDLNIFYWLKSVDLSGNEEIYGPVQVILSNDTNSSPVIAPVNKLYPPFPNPFNPTTTITYSIDRAQFVELEIYNIKGQLVRNLFSGHVANPKRKHRLVWDGKDNNNKKVSSQMYLVKLKLEKEIITQKLLLIK